MFHNPHQARALKARAFFVLHTLGRFWYAHVCNLLADQRKEQSEGIRIWHGKLEKAGNGASTSRVCDPSLVRGQTLGGAVEWAAFVRTKTLSVLGSIAVVPEHKRTPAIGKNGLRND
jgi:hypothetical protein